MRVQRAKRLIDQTPLLMTEIAGRAGFASIRSFNASFREVYRCTPSELRRGRSEPQKLDRWLYSRP